MDDSITNSVSIIPGSSNMSECNIQNDDLPDEIVRDILSRLPVKSLLRFMLVSKQFKRIISDNHFIKSHLKKSESLSTCYRILIPTFPLLLLNYNSPPKDTNALIELDCPFQNPRNVIKILCPCNGLVCLIDRSNDLTIYNPSTRRYFKLVQSSQHIDYVYGFGYGSNPSDLRVVRFPMFARDNTRFGTYDFIDTAGVFLNGSVHWLARYSNVDGQKRVIASFDVLNETFTGIYLPPSKPYVPYYMLGVLKGCLYVLRDDVHDIEVEVWVMKEYGVVNSWSMFVKMPLDVWTGDLSYLRPLRLLNDDEIVVEIELQWFAVYNIKKKTFRHVKGVGDLKWFGEATVYVERLVSPEVSCLLY
ncbi:F-box/kelch-repeat protein At3g06240-like [Bidens hawaiensis]|uniref:F-box/kelch-repeat protein At3g06240-like n=1 Tax=Bidens hawaiensis TaxID=980011 RepID=UPI004049B5D8